MHPFAGQGQVRSYLLAMAPRSQYLISFSAWLIVYTLAD